LPIKNIYKRITQYPQGLVCLSLPVQDIYKRMI